MKIYKFLILLLILFFVNSVTTSALPRFAIRLNDRCVDCHTNPTGGNLRNDNGWFYGKYVISMISPREQDFKMSPKLTDNISIGFDYRMQYLYSQEKKRTDFQDMTGSIYTGVAVSKKIDVQARYDFVNQIWEAYGVLKILPNDSYIKVGSFQPYYGIRLDDHTAYTRGGDFNLLFATGAQQGLIYNPFYIETGAEVGVNIGKISMITMSAGKSRFNKSFISDPTYTARIQVTPKIGKAGLLFGGSFASTKAPHDTKFFGGFFGFGYDRFALLAEYDIAKDYLGVGTDSQMLMAEISYQLIVGLEAIVRYDRFDPNKDIKKDELSHIIMGFEFFPYSFIEIRPQFRIHLEDPKRDNNSAVIQVHLWY